MVKEWAVMYQDDLMELWKAIQKLSMLSHWQERGFLSHSAIILKKVYDCSLLLKEEAFKPLLNDALFRSVKTDRHGYGIIWPDEIDLSESELWRNGSPVEQNDRAAA